MRENARYIVFAGARRLSQGSQAASRVRDGVHPVNPARGKAAFALAVATGSTDQRRSIGMMSLAARQRCRRERRAAVVEVVR